MWFIGIHLKQLHYHKSVKRHHNKNKTTCMWRLTKTKIELLTRW